MASSLILDSWPQATGFDTASYYNHFLEQMQFGMPGMPGVLPSQSDDIIGAYTHEMLPFGDSTGMKVKVYQGRVTAKGIFAKIKDSDAVAGVFPLDVTPAHATLYRIDRVIARFDLASGVVTLRMLDGTAAVIASVVPPSLTQNATTWDVELAWVFVAPTVSTINPSDVHDARTSSTTMAERLRAGQVPSMFMNGGMRIWSRPFSTGSTITGIASNAHGPDKWLYTKAGAVVHDLIRAAGFTTIGANVPHANYALHLDVTTADAAIAAGDICVIGQKVEGWRWEPYAGRQFTIRFWAEDTIPGIHCVAFRNSGGDQSYVAEFMIYATDTPEEKMITVPASPSGGTWDYQNGSGIYVTWALSCGSTFQAPAGQGSWQAGSYLGTANQVNATGSTANNFKLWGVTSALGNYCPPYVQPSYLADLEDCLRYCYVVNGPDDGNGGGATALVPGHGYVNATNSALLFVPLPVPMRGVPSVAKVGTFNIVDSSSGVFATSAEAVSGGGLSTPNAVRVAATISGATQGRPCYWAGSGGAGDRLIFSADIP